MDMDEITGGQRHHQPVFRASGLGCLRGDDMASHEYLN
jgi:hypothetical protein